MKLFVNEGKFNNSELATLVIKHGRFKIFIKKVQWHIRGHETLFTLNLLVVKIVLACVYL
jgi:hypothetical protein